MASLASLDVVTTNLSRFSPWRWQFLLLYASSSCLHLPPSSPTTIGSPMPPSSNVLMHRFFFIITTASSSHLHGWRRRCLASPRLTDTPPSPFLLHVWPEHHQPHRNLIGDTRSSPFYSLPAALHTSFITSIILTTTFLCVLVSFNAGNSHCPSSSLPIIIHYLGWPWQQQCPTW